MVGDEKRPRSQRRRKIGVMRDSSTIYLSLKIELGVEELGPLQR